MPRDASGAYVMPANPANPAVPLTPINSTAFNALMDDVEDALSYTEALQDWSERASPEGEIVGTTDTQTITNKTIDASLNNILDLDTAHFAPDVIDTDIALTANSDTRLATQRAVKSYADAIATGSQWKDSVVVATAAAGTLASSFENGDTVNGVVLATGDRILIKNQAASAENGIYVVAATGAPTRPVDADDGAELTSAIVPVLGGSVDGNTIWVCTSQNITIGSTAIAFTQIPGTASGVTVPIATDPEIRAGLNNSKMVTPAGLRTHQEGFGDRPNWYGITFDGATDDTAAWNTAIAAINAGDTRSLLLPAGTSFINAPLDHLLADQWTIFGQGFAATKIEREVGAGTNGTFFNIGNAGNSANDWLLGGMFIQTRNNTASLAGNPILVNRSIHGHIDLIRVINTAGFVTLGNAADDTNANQTKITRCQGDVYAPATNGRIFHIVQSSGLFVSECFFTGLGTAHASYRGVLVQPQSGQNIDASYWDRCIFNFPVDSPSYVYEVDCTNGNIGTQVHTGCTFDFGTTACIYLHCDAVHDPIANINNFQFVNSRCTGKVGGKGVVINNLSTDASIKNFQWIGGTNTGNNTTVATVNSSGGHVSAAWTNVGFLDLGGDVSGPAVSAGGAGVNIRLQGCWVGTGAEEPPIDCDFTHLLTLTAPVERVICSDNDASLATAGATNLAAGAPLAGHVIGPNIGPSGVVSILPGSYAGDAAAAAASIPVGGLYRNGSAVQIRVA